MMLKKVILRLLDGDTDFFDVITGILQVGYHHVCL